MVRYTVYLQGDTAKAPHDAAEVLMKARFDLRVDHRQSAFGSEDDVEEEICV